MHSFLIVGGVKDSRMTRIDGTLKDREVSAFDRVVLKSDDGAIGVAEVRDFTKKLSLTPFNGNTLAGIIEDANLLTVEAQNALLKTLEEPSPKAIILLETINSNLLLPTIVSRCQVISLGTGDQYSDDELKKMTDEIKQIGEARVGQKIKMIDTVATDREAAKAWVEKAIFASREALLQEYSSVIPAPSVIPAAPVRQAGIHQDGSPIRSGMTTQFLRRLLTAQRQLSANVTPRLVLDAVFLDNTTQ